MIWKYFPLVALFLCAASAFGDAVEYEVIVNTSSIAGTSGSLDFQFNPGPSTTQAASLQILDFASDGVLATLPSLTGDATGALPGDLTFMNDQFYNDYFEGFTFGTTISFEVSLFGPALSEPDLTDSSGSSFGFSMFSDSAGTIPTLTSDTANGYAFTVAVNLDGSITASNFSAQTSLVQQVSPVPEPAGFVTSLLLIAIALISHACFERLRYASR
jgi:hypothetical protein